MKTPFRILACFCFALFSFRNSYSQPAWTAAASLGNGATPRYNATGLAIGSKGYIGTGFFNSHFYNDFFEYDATSNSWSQKSNFGGAGRQGATSFSIGTKGYTGLGYDGLSYKNDFWEYDQASDTWTQKANFGGTGRSGAVGFAIGTKGYMGTGYTGTARVADFWEYDQASNSWLQKANFPGSGRSAAAGFAIGTKGYLGTGYTGSVRLNDFWEYNQSTNIWTQKANFGGTARSNTVSFAIGSKGYIGTGLDGTYKNDFWEYNPTTNTWAQKAAFGGAGRYNAAGFSLGTKGYIGTGFDGLTPKYDFWEYDQTANTWSQKTIFGGYARSGAVGFSIDTKGYMGTGNDANGNLSDFWEYNPATNSWTQKANFAGTARTGAAAFATTTKGYVGTGFDGTNYLNDFWEYNPATNSWTQKANFAGTARSEAVGFCIGTKGYIGTGTTGVSKNDFWEYDPSANSWVQKAALPAIARQEATGFAINTKGYIATGIDNDFNYYDDLWEYNQANNTWTQKQDFPGGTRRGSIGCTINGKGYLATGYDETDVNDGDVWEYDPSLEMWTRKADFAGANRNSAVFFAVNGQGYLGFGDDGAIVKNDLWKFNPANTITVNATICAGTNTSISFSTSNYFSSGNVFTAQLSDGNGNFTAPVNIGSLNGTSSGTINATIPANSSPGNNYFIRIIGSNPSQTIITSGVLTINTSPVITSCPSNVTAASLPGVCNALVFYDNAVATGNPSPTITYSQNSGTLFTGGVTNVLVTATNSCGSATCNFSVTVTDNQAPVIVCPLNVNTNTTAGQCGASGVNLGTPVVIDNCSSPLVTNNAPSVFPVGTTTVIWTATDVSGNMGTCNQTVTVTDNQPPSITCPATVIVNAASGLCAASGVSLGTPTTSDNCGVASVTNNAPASFPVGNTTVNWTVTDVNGNTASCAQTVTVIDNQLPSISCPSNINVNAANGSCSASGVNLGTPSTSDNCGIASVTNNAPSSFPVGTTTVKWTATDVNGNKSTCNQLVTVVDNQLPSITCPSNVNVNAANGLCSASGVSLGTPVTSDNCGIASVTNNAPSSFPVGTTTVKWTATDVNGNFATCNQLVTVTDNQVPVISGCPSNIITCTNPVTWTAPSASDNCGIASLTTNHNPGETFPSGTTTVTYTATDVNGKTSTCSFTVTISAPVYTVTATGSTTVCKPATVTLSVAPAGTAYKWYKNNAAINTATASTYVAKATANYYCKVTSTCGTVNSNTVSVTISALPAATVSPSGNVTMCAGQTKTLTANSGAGYTYQWMKGSATIAGATNMTYVATAAGSFKVKVTNSSGCSKTSAATKITITCKDDLDAFADLNVFPNPTSGTFTIKYQLTDSHDAIIQISDVLGRILYTRNVTGESDDLQINLSDEPAGIYFIRLISEVKTQVKQLEIVH